MIFGYFTLFVALVISAVAAYYSIVGLTAIFAAAVIPIIIMGAALEVGKVTAAVWLKLNWARAKWTYKIYLVPAVAFLMVLTSMGIFGFLSKAHSDQSLVSGDSQAKVAIYDEKIRTAKDNIEANRRALKQMDEAVDQVMARSTDEKGADKAVAIRRSQQKERGRLITEIEAEQKKISQYNEEAAPLRAEFRKVEADVGPIKYIAALIYGDNPDANLLERAVRWVIILIVAVFDPLALVLILAAQQTLRWARDDKDNIPDSAPVYTYETFEKPTAEEKDDLFPTYEEITPRQDPHEVGWMYTGAGIPVTKDDDDESLLKKYPYLSRPFVHFTDTKPMVYKAEEPAPESIPEPKPEPEVKPRRIRKPRLVEPVAKQTVQPATESANDELVDDAGVSPERPGDYVAPAIPEARRPYKAPPPPTPPEAINLKKSQLVADNIDTTPANSSFGIAFPDSAGKGDMFLRVDYLPNRLYKFNGNKWIEVDKSKTDSYTYDEQYILFLIEKLQSGEYDLDQLSASEQELVAEKLKQITNDKT